MEAEAEAQVQAGAEAGLRRLVGFGRLLRRRGLPVGTGRILVFCQAVAALDRFDRGSLYWAGRLTMVARKQDFDAYGAAFRAYFPAERDRATDLIAEWVSQTQGSEADAGGIELLLEEGFAEEGWTPAEEQDQDDEADSEAVIGLIASAAEVLHGKAFEDLTELERLHANQLIRALALRLPSKRTRRRRPSPHGAQFDFRRTVRASLRTQGEPFRRAWRDRRERPRPLVLILDVSGSMSSYSRALMQFGFAAIRAGKRVEVFCFGTRLTRLTRALRRSEPDEALRQVAAAVIDWDGGTRIGASLKELLDRWSQHASMRGAVMVLCSDGLERGDPQLLADQMARLSRLSHRLIWLNPLKGSPRYEPLARGMAAALPHIDLFLPGHNLASLEALCQVLEAQR